MRHSAHGVHVTCRPLSRSWLSPGLQPCQFVPYHALLTCFGVHLPPCASYLQKKLQDFAVKKGIDDMPRLISEMGIKSA